MNARGVVALILILGIGGFVAYNYLKTWQPWPTDGVTLPSTIDGDLNKLNPNTLGYETYLGWGIPNGAYFLQYENSHGMFYNVWLLDTNEAYIKDVSRYNVVVGNFVNTTGYWHGTVGTLLNSSNIDGWEGNLFISENMVANSFPSF